MSDEPVNTPTVIVNPEQPPTIDPMTERIVKLEGRVSSVQEELQRDISSARNELSEQIGSVRSEVDRTIADRFGSIENKLGTIEEKLSKSPKEEAEPDKQPGPPSTNVEEVMRESELTRITTNPTEIKPPPLPRGIRGRRHARRAS